MRGARSLRCSTSGNGPMKCPRTPLYTPVRSHGAPDALGNRHQRPGRDANCRIPLSALSSRESSRARSSLDPSNCGASSRSSSNNDWPGRGSRLRNRSSPTSCTGRERTSMAVPIPSSGWTPGAFATNCASTTRADPNPSSSRCRRAATYRSSNANSVSPTHTAPPVVAPELPQTPPVVTRRRFPTSGVRGSPSALWRSSLRLSPPRSYGAPPQPVSAPAQLLPLASYPGVEGPPALSPGRQPRRLRLVGAAPTPGPTDIYVKAVESEALRRLTATPGSETSPAWSPDGHSIAFVRDGQGVFTMSQLGGAERQVSASGTHVAWAGDSNRFSSATGKRTPVPLASTRCSSTRWTVAG